MYCTKCANRIEKESSKYCVNCGILIKFKKITFHTQNNRTIIKYSIIVFLLIIIVFSYMFVSSISNSNLIILEIETSERRLIYNCNNITTQVESAEDLQILSIYLKMVLEDAAQNDRQLVVLGWSRERNIRVIEKDIVEYLCRYGLTTK